MILFLGTPSSSRGYHRYSQVVHSACKAVRISCRFRGGFRSPCTGPRKDPYHGSREESPPMGNPHGSVHLAVRQFVPARHEGGAAQVVASPSGAFPAHHQPPVPLSRVRCIRGADALSQQARQSSHAGGQVGAHEADQTGTKGACRLLRNSPKLPSAMHGVLSTLLRRGSPFRVLGRWVRRCKRPAAR